MNGVDGRSSDKIHKTNGKKNGGGGIGKAAAGRVLQSRVVTQSDPGERLVATLKTNPPACSVAVSLASGLFRVSKPRSNDHYYTEDRGLRRGDRVIFSFSLSLCLTAPSTKTRMPGEWFITSCGFTVHAFLCSSFFSRSFPASSN